MNLLSESEFLKLSITEQREYLEVLHALTPKYTLAEFVARTSPFVLDPWQTIICKHLERCKTGVGERLLIHAPPQTGKSHIVSKRFPAWIIGEDPTHRVVLACYNETHAMAFGEVNLAVIRSVEYQTMYPDIKLKNPVSIAAFSTLQRCAVMDAQESFSAVGLLSGFTGKGADTLIIDDPYASPDDARSAAVNERVWRWWTELASVRINAATNVVISFHRYHVDDFVGRLMERDGFSYVETT